MFAVFDNPAITVSNELTIYNNKEDYRAITVIFDYIHKAYGFDAGVLYLVNNDGVGSYDMLCSKGLPADYCARVKSVFYGQGFSGVAVVLKSVRVSEDVSSDTRFSRMALLSAGFRNMVSIPLVSGEKVFGILNLMNREVTAIDMYQRSSLKALGLILGQYIDDHLRLLISEQQERLTKQLHFLGMEIFRNNDLDRICTIALEESRVLLNYTCAFINIIKPQFVSYTQGLITQTKNELLEASLQSQIYEYLNRMKYIIDRAELPPSTLLDFFRNNNIDHLCLVNLGVGDRIIGLLAFGLCEQDFNEFSALSCRQIGQSLALAINKYFYNLSEREHAILTEYNRLSWELHDSLAQQLLAISNQLEYIRRKMVCDENCLPIMSDITDLQDLLNQTNGEVRESINSLRVLKSGQESSFSEVLDRYLQVFQKNNTDFKMDIHMTFDEKDIPIRVQTQLFRIIQESLMNVRKHSSATYVALSLTMDKEAFSIRIEDDGKGFDASENGQASNGYGLLIMRERAEEIGAHFSVTSTEGKGTVVLITMQKGLLKI
jgi:signal transduction histidine kinase